MNDNVRRGAGIYRGPVLSGYDLVVVHLSNSLAWRCPSRLMLDQYDRLLGAHHLDVGPGTGWYLAHAHLPQNADITLMDLSPDSLDRAAAQLGSVTHRGVIADVMEPLPDSIDPLDSIAVNYVLHCVPGSWSEKGVAFRHLAAGLTDDGALFGGTILGRGVSHNLPGRGLMALYNRLGVFHNRSDDEAGLDAALRQNFHEIAVDIVGTVAVFSARRPLR